MRYTGFTLIETLLTLGILTVLLSITLPIGFDFYTTSILQSERDTLVSILTRARGLSLTHYHGAPHGIFQTPQTFIIFQGASYATRIQTYDQLFPRTRSITISGPPELIFTPLSGDTGPTTLTLSIGNGNQTITINAEGMIEY